MQRSIGILVAISTMSVLVLAGLHLRDPSTQVTQGQHVTLDNSTISSTVVEEKTFQPDSKPYNLTYGEWIAKYMM